MAQHGLISFFVCVCIIVCGCSNNNHEFKGNTMSKKLEEYRNKRDFSKTTEPTGGSLKSDLVHPIFVVQKHDASHLHYDFRLEIDGVLVSWAIPKGPSLDPSKKRLAVPTEDHPMDYAMFEGMIPTGEYGAGTVMVWDIGSYKNLRDISMEDALKEGKIEISLEGKKLTGAFALIRTERENKDKHDWLFFKMKDDKAKVPGNITETQPKSALTDRTLEEITRDSE